MGEVDINTGRRVTAQPYLGSMFTSQNNSTWTSDQQSDLCFRIHKAVFTPHVDYTANFKNGIASESFDYSSVFIPKMDIQLGGADESNAMTSVKYDFLSVDKSDGVHIDQIIPAKDSQFTTLRKVSSATQDQVGLTLTLRTHSRDVSPIVDIEHMGALTYYNNINSKAEAVAIAAETLKVNGGALAKYVSKPVTLAEGLDADHLRVFLSATTPSGTSIEVYYKVLHGSDGTAFDDRPYALLPMKPKAYTTTLVEEYTEYEFAAENISYTSGGATLVGFKTFAIKVVMYSTNPCFVPRLANIRVIAGS